MADIIPVADVADNNLSRDAIGGKADAAVVTVGTVASLVAYLKGVLNQIGTLVNAGGVASLGAILGDFANTSLATRLGTLVNSGGTASLGAILGDVANSPIATQLTNLQTLPGSSFVTQGTVISSSLPNNTQAGGAITGAASGAIVIEDIILETDATGIVNPVNVNFTTDNARGLTGAANPVVAEAVSALGANKTISCKAEATTKHLPFTLETGKKLYISGSSAAGTGAGVMRVTLQCRRVAQSGSLAAVSI